MLYWLANLDTRGKLFLFGGLGLLANGVLYFINAWVPVLLVLSLGMLFVAFMMKSEDSTDI